MGRPRAVRPRIVPIAYRVDQETADLLDEEIGVEQKPGLVLSRLTKEEREDLRELAARWECTEAQAVRRLIKQGRY